MSHNASRSIRTRLVALAGGFMLSALLIAGGCKSGGQPILPLPGEQQKEAELGGMTQAEIRSQVQAFADTLVARTKQCCDALNTPDQPVEIRIWAQKYETGTMATAYVYATGQNPAVSLLDLVVFVTLKRDALEDHWIPNLLHEKGDAVLQVYKESERDVWALAARILTPEQIKELHALIAKWREDHPNDYYVALVRFGDFMQTYGAPDPKTGQMPSSVFGLLYLDPIPNINPAVDQLKAINQLSERLMFLVGRYQFLINAQVQLAILEAGQSPAALDMLKATNQFTGATAEFANTVKGFPAFITEERERAVNQLLTGVNAQGGQIQAIIKDTNTTIDSTSKASDALLDKADRLSKSIFRLAVAFVLITVAAIWIAAVTYNRVKYRPTNPSR